MVMKVQNIFESVYFVLYIRIYIKKYELFLSSLWSIVLVVKSFTEITPARAQNINLLKTLEENGC